MSALVKLQQGSPEWLAHRQQFRNASETPAVMGVSPWMTPYQLWSIRTGRVPPQETTAPMAHGQAMEPAARAAYEQITENVMVPQVMTDGAYSASLDGITLSGLIVLEVKCPFKMQQSELWKSVQQGVIPEYYRLQMQHQLMVSGASIAHLWVFDGKQGLLLEVLPENLTWQRIRKEWETFQKYLDTDTAPPLTDRDTLQRDDSAWKLAAGLYVDAKRGADDAAASLEKARERLVGLASHPSEAGAGVTVTRYWKAGSVEYKKVPMLTGVDPESYRGVGRTEVRVSVGK